MSGADATVFVPGLGFRGNRGVRLSEPVTVTKDDGSATAVTWCDPVVEVRGPWEVRWRR